MKILEQPAIGNLLIELDQGRGGLLSLTLSAFRRKAGEYDHVVQIVDGMRLR